MNKKYLGIICLLYAVMFSYVIVFDQLKNFLAPSMQIYIKLSIVPLLIIGLVILFKNNNHYQFKIIDLVLILPLVMLILSGDGRLTSSFASNRSTNFNNDNKASISNQEQEKEQSEPAKEDEKIEKNIYDFSNPYFNISDNNYIDLAYYMAESSKAIKFEGKTIKVKGFALKEVEFMSSDYFAIGKYEISCCAADAGYIGFIVKYDKNEISSDKWYEIEGVLEKGKALDENDIMYIKVINIKEINSKGEEQYVYPCYAYGNNACSEVSKYNLEY